MNPSPDQVFEVFKKHFKEIPLTPVSKTPFQALVAVMLSARTRDETTAARCIQLFKVAPTPQKLVKLSPMEIEQLIKPVNFYRGKAKKLKELSQIIIRDFQGEVPQTLEELVTLPGVGRKTANIILARMFNIPAIGVDTHVHRISNMLGWVKTKTPLKTEIELMKVLPQKYWLDINNLFVSIGQQYRSESQLRDFLTKNGLI